MIIEMLEESHTTRWVTVEIDPDDWFAYWGYPLLVSNLGFYEMKDYISDRSIHIKRESYNVIDENTTWEEFWEIPGKEFWEPPANKKVVK